MIWCCQSTSEGNQQNNTRDSTAFHTLSPRPSLLHNYQSISAHPIAFKAAQHTYAETMGESRYDARGAPVMEAALQAPTHPDQDLVLTTIRIDKNSLPG
jgi:hypothetical protein